ncbi:MAG: hypothetical protein PHR82_07310 [Endomicrobiaceae bacterium]|nr:hypothetical protein [Endomicrobiaceae bacterium]
MFLNLKEIYLPSWEIFLKNWWEYVVITVIMFALIFIPLAGSIAQVFIMLAMISAIIKSVRGNTIKFSDFLQFKEILNLKTSVFAIGLGFYYFLIQNVASLSMLLSLVGAVLSVIFFPVFCVLVDKNFNIKETISYSAKLTKDIRVEIILIMLVNLIIAIVGAMLLFVGVFVAMPIGMIATVKVYTILEQKLNSKTQI